MSQTVTGICNMALGHLAVGKAIASITESSAEARACNRFYEQVRDEVLRAFAWPFASITVALQVVATAPNTEWGYSYRLPVDCVTPRRIPSGYRNDTQATAVRFRIARDAAGRVLYTDLPNATLEYTVLVTNPAEFAPDFAQAVALKLAGFIAPLVTGGDPSKLGARALQLYQWQISEARTNAANEGLPDAEPESDSITARY